MAAPVTVALFPGTDEPHAQGFVYAPEGGSDPLHEGTDVVVRKEPGGVVAARCLVVVGKGDAKSVLPLGGLCYAAGCPIPAAGCNAAVAGPAGERGLRAGRSVHSSDWLIAHGSYSLFNCILEQEVCSAPPSRSVEGGAGRQEDALRAGASAG